MPVSKMPRALAPAVCATERNSTLTEGRWRLTRGPSTISTRYCAPLRRSSMWRPPGAIRAWPGSTRSPFWASCTVMSHSWFRRWAKAAVNCSGMCCTMTRPGDSRGRAVRMRSSAWVPPVEVPTATIRSVVWARACRGAVAGSTASALSLGAGAGKGARGTRRRTLACTAARMVVMNSLACSSRKWRRPSRGLAITVNAPAAMASRVVCAPCSVRVEQMMTGVGRSCMIFLRKVMPSMCGISTSSTITSGHSCCMRFMASSGSETAASSSMPGLSCSRAPSVWRISAESSTSRTRMLIVRRPCRACGRWPGPGVAAGAAHRSGFPNARCRGNLRAVAAAPVG